MKRYMLILGGLTLCAMSYISDEPSFGAAGLALLWIAAAEPKG